MSIPIDPALISAPGPVPQLLRDLIHERTGLFFEADRFDLLLEKLRSRAAARDCHSYLDYYYILKYEDSKDTEWRRVMDAFSVQETYFWREADQIQVLIDRVVPEWFKHHSAPLRIWSAACATGEEPYSIAIALAEAGWAQHPIEIMASDASEAAIEKARSGLYRERSFRALPGTLREKYFRATPLGSQLLPEIIARVHFRQANLINPDEIADFARAQVVFCRNVFIYFSPSSIRRVVDFLATQVPPDGFLFVGASESLLKLTQDFELREMGSAFVYVRKERSAN